MKKSFFAFALIVLFAMVSFAQTTVNYNVSRNNYDGDRGITWTPTIDSADTEYSNAFELGAVYNVAGNYDVYVSLTQTAAADSNNCYVYLLRCYGDPTVATNWIESDTIYAAATNTTTPSIKLAGTDFTLTPAPYYKFKAVENDATSTSITIRVDLYAIKQEAF